MGTSTLATTLLVAASFLCALIATGAEAATLPAFRFPSLKNVKIRYSGPVIDYGAIGRDGIPCGGGKPCRRKPANPYNRGCSKLSRCRPGNPAKASINEFNDRKNDGELGLKLEARRDHQHTFADQEVVAKGVISGGDDHHVVKGTTTNSDENYATMAYERMKKYYYCKGGNIMGRRLMGKMR